ncbi:MAG: molybdate ABC transporter permease subunit [Elusimicrobiota bacterium]
MSEAVFLSLKVAALSTALALPLGTGAALLLVRWRSPVRPLVDAAVNLPLVLPPLCTGYILLILFGPRGPLGGLWSALGIAIPFTWIAAVLAAAVVSFPLMVRAAQVGFEAVDAGIEDAARTLGASEADVFLSVTLPLAARGIAAGAVLTFARSLGEFGATILFAGSIAGETRTIPLAIFHYFNIPGAEGKVHALMAVAVALSLAAMLAAHWLVRPAGRRK